MNENETSNEMCSLDVDLCGYTHFSLRAEIRSHSHLFCLHQILRTEICGFFFLRSLFVGCFIFMVSFISHLYIFTLYSMSLANLIRNILSCRFISQDSQTIRTLTLISKTIQSLGNLVSSRSSHQHAKEEFMADLYKKFCTEKHVRAVKEFLDAISTKGMMESLSNSCYADEAILLKDG